MATNFTQDANCMGAFLMEDTGNETDVAQGNTLTETSGTIDRTTDKKFGTYSRTFVASETEYLTHADGLDTDISGNPPAGGGLSIVCWFKANTLPNPAMLVSKYDYDGVNDRQYGLHLTGAATGIRFVVTPDGTNQNDAYGATAPTAEVWTHAAGVYNDTDLRVYKDGSFDGNGDNPQSYTAGISNEPSPFVIGAYDTSSSPEGYFDGLIDDVGIFDRELTSTEVSDIATYGLQGISYTTLYNCTITNATINYP